MWRTFPNVTLWQTFPNVTWWQTFLNVALWWRFSINATLEMNVNNASLYNFVTHHINIALGWMFPNITLWWTFVLSQFDEHFPTSHCDEHFPTSHCDKHFLTSHRDEHSYHPNVMNSSHISQCCIVMNIFIVPMWRIFVMNIPTVPLWQTFMNVALSSTVLPSHSVKYFPTSHCDEHFIPTLHIFNN